MSDGERHFGTPCASDCCQDEDCCCSKECVFDEGGGYCDKHGAEEDRRMRAYFGLRDDMTREQWRDQLERMKPRGDAELAEIMAEARLLK